MNILIHLSNQLLSEALCELLRREEKWFPILCKNGNQPCGINPDIIVVDINTINQKLFSVYPKSKVILLDTGMRHEDVIAIILSYKLYGILPTCTDTRLFKKALKVINEGQIWISNDTIKTFLHDAGLITKTGRINGLTGREKEIIECVCLGYKNKKIASVLSLSEQTVKAHLNRIFRKFNISSRSQLVALALNNQK